MRRGRHSQRPKLKHVKCMKCQSGLCEECVDRLVLLGGRKPICECDRPNHQDLMMGEPRAKQIRDPFTEAIHAPGLTVNIDGEMKYDGALDPEEPKE